MDLIPKPDQVASAASNIAHKVLYGGLADLRPMPRSLIDEGPRREVYHYRPHKQVRATGDPVLLVMPLAAPSMCYDLRRGCSLVEHLVREGRPTYMVEYGEISFADRNLGMEHWIDEAIPEAIRAASEDAGGRPVHVVGWSAGGIFAALVAADQPDLPIASLTLVGSPFDVSRVPMVAPLRPLLKLTRGNIGTPLYRALGGAPKPFVRRAFQLSSGTKLITKPLATLQHLDDTEWLAQIEAVDRFTANMIAYPGRTFGQLYHRMLRSNELVDGTLELGDRTIRIADIRLPVLVFAGNTDGIAPIGAVKAVVPLLTGAAETRFEIVPGGHLGMLTGRAARESTWLILDEWMSEHGSAETLPSPSPEPAKAAKTAKTAKTAKSTRTAKTAPSAKTAATPRKRSEGGSGSGDSAPVAPDRGAIGSNRQRRYASANSRNLGKKA